MAQANSPTESVKSKRDNSTNGCKHSSNDSKDDSKIKGDDSTSADDLNVEQIQVNSCTATANGRPSQLDITAQGRCYH